MNKFKYFSVASELTAFLNDVSNAVSTIVGITYDAGSGKILLIYT